MSHALITTIVVGLGLAFVLGTLAQRLRTSPIVGYLLAGVVVGPFTPGFVVDQSLALQLAEIGIILLMFGVGLHFSLRDLLAVRAIVVPGATVQVAASTLLGVGVAWLADWPPGAGIVFGLSLSVASTVVLMRVLTDRRLLATERGHIALGWLVFQDVLSVIALVLLPPFAALLDAESGPAAASLDLAGLALSLGLTLGKAALFIALMLIVGGRAIPWMLHYIAHTGSRELFRLAVLSVALGVAFAASELFGVSFALGAFLAGVILSESPLSQRAAEESLPLRDAFAVLFFVSVGMLFDPRVLVEQPGPLAAALAVVMVGNAGVAFLMVRAFGYSLAAALLVAAGLAQIGEFSFILADLGISLGLLSIDARNLILGASILSILANPILLALLDRMRPWVRRQETGPTAPDAAEDVVEEELPITRLHGHAVLVGYGRVGKLVGEGLRQAGWPLLVIETASDPIQPLRAEGVEAIVGNAAEERVLKAANLAAARLLMVAIPDAFEGGQIVEQARAANPRLDIIARAHFDAEVDHLTQHGANVVIMGEREIARAMLEYAPPREATPPDPERAPPVRAAAR